MHMKRREFLAAAVGALVIPQGVAAMSTEKTPVPVSLKSQDMVLYPLENGNYGRGIVTGFSHASAEHAQSVPGHKRGDGTVVVVGDNGQRNLRFFSEQLTKLSV